LPEEEELRCCYLQWCAERFGPEALHNTENVIAVDADTHVKISAYYSSKLKPGLFTKMADPLHRS
jgi:hypothetical protein